MVQQIHSLRASGVISSHAAKAFGAEVRALRKSAGIPWTTPPVISFLAMTTLYVRYDIGSITVVFRNPSRV